MVKILKFGQNPETWLPEGATCTGYKMWPPGGATCIKAVYVCAEYDHSSHCDHCDDGPPIMIVEDMIIKTMMTTTILIDNQLRIVYLRFSGAYYFQASPTLQYHHFHHNFPYSQS